MFRWYEDTPDIEKICNMGHCPSIRDHYRSQLLSIFDEFVLLSSSIYRQLIILDEEHDHTSISHEHQVHSLRTVPTDMKFHQLHALHWDTGIGVKA